MSLDMLGHVDFDLNSSIAGGVVLVTPQPGGYTGPGGVWVDGGPDVETDLHFVNVVQGDMKTAEFLSGMDGGGTVNPSDVRIVHINDGTMLYPDDNSKFAQTLKFSDGQSVRTWRVRFADNRPHRNFCKAIVERYRGSK